jgi:hypothetical protein
MSTDSLARAVPSALSLLETRSVLAIAVTTAMEEPTWPFGRATAVPELPARSAVGASFGDFE